MSALEHELHTAEVSEGGPAALHVGPVEKLEAVGVGNRAQSRDRIGRTAIEDQVAAASFFHVVSCELSSDLGKGFVGFDHVEQSADCVTQGRGPLSQPIRFVARTRDCRDSAD
jgi:hypothetical protein